MRLTLVPVVVLGLLLSACSSAPAPEYIPPDEGSEVPAETPEEPSLIGDACALLDEAFLDSALESVEAPFGGRLDFQDHLQSAPSEYCSWADPTIPAEIQVTLEDASTAELDDHSERAFNIDVDPVVEPQDGPGEKAVILLDTAFEKSGSEPLAYGYFFVSSGTAVFVKVTFVDIGRDLLRVIADEADARIRGS